MQLMLRVMVVLVGAITVLMGGAMVVARARAETPPSAWIAFRGRTLPSSTGQTASTRGEGGIYVVRADGRALRRVIAVEPVGNDWLRDLQWSPDGEWLLFTSDMGQELDVYRVRMNGHQLQDLTDSTGNNDNAAWSPDGQWIAFVSDRAGGFSLYRMRPDGSDVQQLTAPSDHQRFLVWSPDGAWIAFVDASGFEQDIYRVRADGTDLQRLTNSPEWAVETLLWLPDGAWLIYEVQRADGGQAVFRTRIETGDIQRLLDWNPEAYFHSVSPDGRWAVLSRRQSTGLKLFRMRTDGSDVRFLNPADVTRWINQWGGPWSPDGRWIAYMNMGSSGSALYRLPSAGGPAQALVDPKLSVSEPVWSPPIHRAFLWWLVIGIGVGLAAVGIAFQPHP